MRSAAVQRFVLALRAGDVSTACVLSHTPHTSGVCGRNIS
jgi:hypothetical protein